MSDVTFSVACDQRHGDALGPDSRVSVFRCFEGIAQNLIDLLIVGNQPACERTQDIANGENAVTGNIGMNDESCRIDEENAGI